MVHLLLLRCNFCTVHDVCLMFSGALSGSETFSESVLPAVIDSVQCNGSEEGLLDCGSTVAMLCGQYDDADVVCQGNLLPALG